MLLNSSSNRKLRSSRRPEHLYREKVKRVGWVRFATHETCLYDTNKFYQVSHLPMLAFDLKQSRQVSCASTPWHVQASMKISILIKIHFLGNFMHFNNRYILQNKVINGCFSLQPCTTSNLT